MKNKSLKSAFLLLLTALIWGLAFVAQSEGMRTLGTYTFYTSRCVLSVMFLLCVLVIRKIFNKTKGKLMAENKPSGTRRDLFVAGTLCGISMFAATIAQQNGLIYTTVGKSGFITALYILIVPILGIFLKKKVAPILWLCVLIALFGMYLLCLSDGGGINKGDIYTLVCAFLYSIQILTIDRYAGKVDVIALSMFQFGLGAIISCICMFLFEEPTVSQFMVAAVPVLYAGILSSGVAFTLQIAAQRHISPTLATLIMSLESVFAALFGWILLRQALSSREIVGCVLVFSAIILSELPLGNLPMIKKRKTLKLGIDKTPDPDI